ncbi:MAG TPA: GWxTD domain-containing protein [Candidatus Sulfotelmatobacter sp.]|jgi:GWxTD domain-containing protein|nr:GWxTD domain-containing protein [Candidatus Sulfotelmatobacter sp.]
MRHPGPRPSLSFVALTISVFFGSSALHAQDGPVSQQPSQNPKIAPTNKKQRKKAKDELAYQYGEWLSEEVPIIITKEEKDAFLRLGTNEEREQFIEDFWRRRNPDPDSPTNSFKEEHYRRIAYANEHFASGIPGWRTDRGHIYILWGPPDEIESHPTGGTYDRPMWQGGGSTQTYSWELWRYRHLEGISDNVELEFVDPSGSGEYHLTRDPGEKDALAHVPGAGSSLSEMLYGASKAQRFSNSNGTTLPAPIGGVPSDKSEFAMNDLYFRVMQPPEHLKDMTTLVSTRMLSNPMQVAYDVAYLRVTSDSILVPITLQVPNREMGFRGKNGVQSAVLNVYARITTPGGRLVQSFEDTVARDFPESLFQKSLDQSSIYQKSVPLHPGLYRLDVVVKDVETGNIGVIETSLRVPQYEEGVLNASSLVLADKIESVPSGQVGLGPFVFGPYKVRPRLSHVFTNPDNLGIFMQLYSLKLDEIFHQTSVSATYRLLRDKKEIWSSTETSGSIRRDGEQVTLNRRLPLAAFAPGKYTLEIEVTDQISRQTVIRTADFEISSVAH